MNTTQTTKECTNFPVDILDIDKFNLYTLNTYSQFYVPLIKYYSPIQIKSRMNDDEINKVKQQNLQSLMLSQLKYNYMIDNIMEYLNINPILFNKIIVQPIENLLKNNIVEGWYLRKSFAKERNLESYTDEDWMVIFAQYSISYDWQDLFEYIFNEDPNNIWNKYTEKHKSDIVFNVPKDKIKHIKLINYNDVKNIIKNLLFSNVRLTEEQIKNVLKNLDYSNIIEQCRIDYLLNNIKINETKILIIDIIIDFYKNNKRNWIGQKLPLIFKTPNDILKYIQYKFHPELKGTFSQVLKPFWKFRHFKIQKSYRKILLDQLEKMYINYKDKNKFYDEMLKKWDLWKKVFYCLKYDNKQIMLNKYPNTMKFYYNYPDYIVYKNEEYFYHIFEEYKKSMDRIGAFNMLMKYNPSEFIRYLIEYMKNVHNIDNIDLVQLENTLKSTNFKLLVQIYNILITMKDYYTKKHLKIFHNSPKGLMLNDNVLEYKTDKLKIYEINEEVYDIILYIIETIISNKLQHKFKNKKIYIDPILNNKTLYYSTRETNIESLSGEIYPKGSAIDIKEIIDKKYRRSYYKNRNIMEK